MESTIREFERAHCSGTRKSTSSNSQIESEVLTSQCATKPQAESSTVSTVKIAARQRLSVGAVCRLERRRCRKRRSYWSRSYPDREGKAWTTCLDVVLEVSVQRDNTRKDGARKTEERAPGHSERIA